MAEKLVRTSVVLSVFVILSLFSGCGVGATNLTDDDNGATVSLRPGERVTISLASNPTTGYSWQVVAIDEALLEMVAEPEYQPEAKAEGLVGAGGTESFLFQALAPGEATLTLGYARPWEVDVAPIETFSVHVVVE